jgi:hypothetical protein
LVIPVSVFLGILVYSFNSSDSVGTVELYENNHNSLAILPVYKIGKFCYVQPYGNFNTRDVLHKDGRANDGVLEYTWSLIIKEKKPSVAADIAWFQKNCIDPLDQLINKSSYADRADIN